MREMRKALVACRMEGRHVECGVWSAGVRVCKHLEVAILVQWLYFF